jgi:hypothetical protein
MKIILGILVMLMAVAMAGNVMGLCNLEPDCNTCQKCSPVYDCIPDTSQNGENCIPYNQCSHGTCNLNGVCSNLVNYPSGTNCGQESNYNCKTCDGNGNCNGNVPEGTLCTPGNLGTRSVYCFTCTGNGVCASRTGTRCSDCKVCSSGQECTVFADSSNCEGNGNCPQGQFCEMKVNLDPDECKCKPNPPAPEFGDNNNQTWLIVVAIVAAATLFVVMRKKK